MDFTPNPDQAALSSAIDRLAARFETKPTEFHGFALHGRELEQELVSGEYFDIARVPELGPVSAALAVERLARLPCTAEIALSMLVRPQLPGEEWPRPLALLENGRPGRFVASARTLIVIEDERIGLLRPETTDLESVESLYAYPMGAMKTRELFTPLSEAEADTLRTWLRVALAAEAAGLMQAAIAATVEHLSVRKQFGRALGSFQALRHRMAECAVLAGGVRLLALKAAWSGCRGRCGARCLPRPGQCHAHRVRPAPDARCDGHDARIVAAPVDLSTEGAARGSGRARWTGGRGRASLLRPGYKRLTNDSQAARWDADSLAAAGWKSATIDGFTGQVGPFWFRREESGHRVIGLLVEQRHSNSHLGTLHGGVVMTFADIALGAGADDALGGASSVTASLQTHFIAVARIGEFISCRPEVVRRTRHLVFVRGLIVVGERTIASADGIWKVLEPKAGVVAAATGIDPQS